MWRLLPVLALVGCSTVTMQTTDPRRAIVLAPVRASVGPFASIQIREGETFYPATIDGRPGWCSASATYFAPAESRFSCLFDTTGDRLEGWFREAYIAGTASVSRHAVDVPYRVVATPPLPSR